MSHEEIKKISEKIYQLKEDYKEKITLSFDDAQCFPFLLKSMDQINYTKLCGDFFCRIDSNGDIFPCPFLEMKVGNIFEADLKEIWKNPLLKKLRYLSWGTNLKGICTSCSHKEICNGGCRSRALEVFGEIEAKDPLCWVK